MSDDFRWTLVRTPAGLCTLIGRMGSDRILVSQNAQHQVEYMNKCRKEGKNFSNKVRLPCAMWIFGVCWTHTKIFPTSKKCNLCENLQGVNTPVSI